MSEIQEATVWDFSISKTKSARGTKYQIEYFSDAELTDEEVISFVPVLFESQQNPPPQPAVRLNYRQRD